MVDVRLIFNDRFFEDGWAEPYLVVLHFSKLHKTECPTMISMDVQKCINEMIGHEGYDCSEDGIDQILEKYQSIEPRLDSWEFEHIAGVCFGPDEFLLE